MKTAVLAILILIVPMTAQSQQNSPHHPDFRKCKKCLLALTRAMAFLKENYRKDDVTRVIKSKLAGYMLGGFAFMMEGNSPTEISECVKYCCNAIKDSGYNRNWYLSMSSFFLTEYSLRYGLTAPVQAALNEGLRIAAAQQEATGGWCHHLEMWKEQDYNKKGGGKDLGIVTAMLCGAFLEEKAMGIDPGPVADRAMRNLESLSDGFGFRYGTDNNVHDTCMSRGAFVLLGLQATNRFDHPFFPKIVAGLDKRFTSIEKGHGFGPLHYFAVAAAMHRLGPLEYRKFTDEYLDKLIAAQGPDGSLQLSSDGGSGTMIDAVASTAVLGCTIMMQKEGIFTFKPKRVEAVKRTGPSPFSKESSGNN